MGIRDFFSSYTQIERALLELYASTISVARAISESEARKTAEDMLKQAIEESKEEGTYHLPHTFGDIILGSARTDHHAIRNLAEEMRNNIPKKKAEGVRDEDIRWWWNLNDIERRIMVKVDDVARTALFLHELDLGEDPPEAAAKVRKFHPMYGDPDDTTHTKGDDRPLPYELKDRINTYVEKRGKANPDGFKREVEASSTYNALVRREIRTGNI